MDMPGGKVGNHHQDREIAKNNDKQQKRAHNSYSHEKPNIRKSWIYIQPEDFLDG
jgi:hypothetical protein